MTDILSAQHDVIGSSHGGFAFLLTTGMGWLLCGILARRLTVKTTALMVLFQGFVTIPAAFLLERALGYPSGAPDNPLTPLAIYLAISQSVAIPAVLIAYYRAPDYVPAALAAIVGAHLLPYAWLQQSTTYAILAGLVGWAPLVIMRTAKARGIWAVPLFVGACLLIGAVWIDWSLR